MTGDICYIHILTMYTQNPRAPLVFLVMSNRTKVDTILGEDMNKRVTQSDTEILIEISFTYVAVFDGG